MIPVDERSYYTVSEAAQLLEVSPSTVWRWIDAERLPAYRVGPKTIRIKKEDLSALVNPLRRSDADRRSEGPPDVLAPVSEEQLARRQAAIRQILAHRVSIAPLTTSDLIRKVRRERLKHDPPR